MTVDQVSMKHSLNSNQFIKQQEWDTAKIILDN